ncbi:S-adenosyl-L-methionine-dependent methyltransferase [Fimicolochytrium jonesii]|uniref:S-adenosyl-L-methionine-dependent methyltransferase n=1 Tax=Fimicolochytrium jonesii TaxID=1396493 RepID=UPI0022FEED94|nr:S-adenosyl-L-methionine-dependent methyltransferase [Fimicolochytrium jonesii]KAI8819569.1 S-adenosyl-L-methionine-dependent methyltransferase [Fimicolochytrium jonesii]
MTEFSEEKIRVCEAILARTEGAASEFLAGKLKKETARNWDLFYKRNTTNFFKDRHWVEREFPELRPVAGIAPASKCGCASLFKGCGVGNFIFPTLDSNSDLFIYGCDLSKRAVDFVKADAKYDTQRCKAFVCDITSQPLTDNVPPHSLDLVSALFCFSAIPPDQMPPAVENLKSVLKPGGIVLFRDYGIYDAAQLRFKPTSKLSDRLYARHDGTLSYFFSTADLDRLFCANGFVPIENTYVVKTVVNRKRELHMERVFVQARLRYQP